MTLPRLKRCPMDDILSDFFCAEGKLYEQDERGNAFVIGQCCKCVKATMFGYTLDGPAQRPLGSNADEWNLFISENKDNSVYLAVQIAEAIDEAERRGMAKVMYEHDRN